MKRYFFGRCSQFHYVNSDDLYFPADRTIGCGTFIDYIDNIHGCGTFIVLKRSAAIIKYIAIYKPPVHPMLFQRLVSF